MTKTIENIKFQIQHIRDPLKKKSEEWKETADQWHVTIYHDTGMFTLEYYTGSGHRKKIGKGFNERTIAQTPKIKDVIYSMFIDSTAMNENFSDWCSNYGYSDDSISALNTYKECLEQGRKLRKLGLSQEYLEKLFENY